MREREDSIAHHMNYCTHYDGRALVMKPYGCRAGVKYADVGKTMSDRPCISGHERHDCLTVCPKWVRTTREQAIEFEEAFERKMKAFSLALPFVGKWRVKPKPKHDRVESVECPACKGALHLSQSSYNGHVHAHCETPDCVSFME